MIESTQLRDLLSAVGELLEEKGEPASIVVVGGASLNLSGLVNRATDDVDVIARAEGDGESTLIPPDPMPEPLRDAVERVRRDFGLQPGWLNTAVANQWETSLPPSLKEDLTWQTYGGLRVGVAGRRPLIALKLLAAVDQGAPERALSGSCSVGSHRRGARGGQRMGPFGRPVANCCPAHRSGHRTCARRR